MGDICWDVLRIRAHRRCRIGTYPSIPAELIVWSLEQQKLDFWFILQAGCRRPGCVLQAADVEPLQPRLENSSESGSGSFARPNLSKQKATIAHPSIEGLQVSVFKHHESFTFSLLKQNAESNYCLQNVYIFIF